MCHCGVHHHAGSGSTSGMPAFWGTMASVGDAQRVVPAERWDIDAVYSPDTLPGKMSVSVRQGPSLPPCAACPEQ